VSGRKVAADGVWIRKSEGPTLKRASAVVDVVSRDPCGGFWRSFASRRYRLAIAFVESPEGRRSKVAQLKTDQH
jgi:hypothetical protein